MQLQTFKAPTMAEALAQVKSVMGADAVILHTRTFQVRKCMGLMRKEMVEITAGKGINIGSRRRGGDGKTDSGRGDAGGASGNKPGGAPPGTYGANGQARPLSQNAPRNAVEGGRQLMETPAATAAAMMGLSQEIGALKSMVKDLVQASKVKQQPDVPENLFDYYLNLVQNEVAEELATEVVQNIQKQVRPERFGDQQYINGKIVEQLEKLIPTTGPITRTKKQGPHVVALIGPTGVGKTTTIAKLAANLKLRERRKVGLITLDTYRIAAVDQLKRYADILGAPLKVVNGADDLKDALSALNDQEFILIDTAGRSPNDAAKLKELKTVLDGCKPDEVHLVLSGTASQDCVELAVAKFGEVRVDKMIFTKLDEAAHVGILLNVVRKVNKSLSYITTGQDVPDDIEVGKGKRLAQMIMGKM